MSPCNVLTAGLGDMITQPFVVILNSATVGVGDYIRGSVVVDLDAHLALSTLTVQFTGRSKAFFSVPKKEQVLVYDQNGNARYQTQIRESNITRVPVLAPVAED